MLHIAFAKGRIAKTVMKNLAAAGFNFPTYDDDSRKLIFTDETGMLKVTLVKSPDVVVYVERGAADAGVVGSDVIEEDGPATRTCSSTLASQSAGWPSQASRAARTSSKKG